MASKDRRYKATIAAAFLVALVLGVALGSAMSPRPVCAPCPKTIITETIERTQTVASIQSTTGTEITTTATATAQRAIELSMSISKKRVSTGDYVSFSAHTSWEGVSLITSMKVTVVAPDGRVVLSDDHVDSYYWGQWSVPSDAKWGVYTVTVVASKEGYVSAQASDTFEVI